MDGEWVLNDDAAAARRGLFVLSSTASGGHDNRCAQGQD